MRLYPSILAMLLWPAFGLAQQLPQAQPPSCQEQLAKSLTREEAIQQLATQRREAVVLYFQEDGRKANEELLNANKTIQDLRKEIEILKNGASSAGKEAK